MPLLFTPPISREHSQFLRKTISELRCRHLHCFPPFSRTGIPCFPSGSGLSSRSDMTAIPVLSNCLRGGGGNDIRPDIWIVQKVRRTFLERYIRRMF